MRKTYQHTLPFSAVRNSDFLSNHWLEKRLPHEPEWDTVQPAAATALGKLADLWTRQKNLVERYDDEAGLEHAFIQPVLETLGWTLKYQAFLQGRKPDYALFTAPDAHALAINAGRDNPDFWKHPTLLADAKAWHVSLDRPITSGSQREFPPQQIEWYLDRSSLDYAILTNGKLWRLIPRQRAAHQPRFQTFLECDLAALLTRYEKNHLDYNTLDDFRRFFLFFSPHAFVSSPAVEPLIKRAIAGSSAYRLSASEALKERVFEALRLCIEGFLNFPSNNLNPDTDLPACRANAFTLLYRLLFIFFAEDRQLLPFRKNDLYTRNRALSRFRDDIAARLDKIELKQESEFSKTETSYWDEITALFDLIDSGKAAYGVPAYNGGLFNADAHPFLHEHKDRDKNPVAGKKIPDYYLAHVIDSLGRAPDPLHPDAPPVAVDYKDLAIQDLGNIYEGLLELHPIYATYPVRLARARRAAAGQRPEEKYLQPNDPTPAGFSVVATYPEHSVYLANDKGERRASGSYYTPDHIVNYIVENTLGPLCRDIDQKLNAEIAATKAKLKSARGNPRTLLEQDLAKLRADFDDRVLALKILDPAMGSGHFLIRACNFLAEEIATNPHAADPAALNLKSDESTITFWKRKVVESCLYGVDLNPVAVELAKLALWLETVSTTQPLSFLDHHLRHGNSLVGAFVDQLGSLPNEDPLFQNAFQAQVEQKLPLFIGGLNQIRGLPSDTVAEVKAKEKLFLTVVEPLRDSFRFVADLWTAQFFLPKPTRARTPIAPGSPGETSPATTDSSPPAPPPPPLSAADYAALINALGSPKTFLPLRNSSAVTAATAAIQPVHPFHWELEFPDVFFSDKARLPNPGFHAIVGNPPYDVLSEKETKTSISSLQSFLECQPRYSPSISGKNNLYKLFVCQALHILANAGRLGLITPMAILGDKITADIRRQILSVADFTSVDAFPQKDDPKRRVFPEAKLSTTAFTLVKSFPPNNAAFKSRSHPAQFIDEASPSTALSASQLSLYDPVNSTIITCSQTDWDIATRIMQTGRLERLCTIAEFAQGEVNETVQREKGTLATARTGQLVVRGSAICLYVPRETSQGDDLWIDREKFLNGKDNNSKAFDYRHRRVGWQESCPQNNFRRIIASLIPSGEFCNHKINYLSEPSSKHPIEFVLALLNSQLADWYFRIGSTNAAVSHYQIGNLPSPIFAPTKSGADRQLFGTAKAAFDTQKFDQTLALLTPACQSPPFPLAIRDIIIAATERIIAIEQNRGPISRSDRSHLDPRAQPYQDLIDQLFFRLAGLSPAESAALEARLTTML